MSATATTYPYSPGLEGVPAGITTISEIDSAHSSLQYRGIDVHQIAEHGTYEEAAYLLLYGSLPTRRELNSFKERLAAQRDVPQAIYDAIAGMPKGTLLMDSIRSSFGLNWENVLSSPTVDSHINFIDFNLHATVPFALFVRFSLSETLNGST